MNTPVSFEKVWKDIQSKLNPNSQLRNWTVLNGYFGDDITILALSKGSIAVKSPTAKKIQVVPKSDFEAVWHLWEGYKRG